MSASTYRSVAVASAFSPRFVQVLSEARRVARRFDAELNIIYVGRHDEQADAMFREVVRDLGIRLNAPVHYRDAADPAQAIVELVKEHGFDLLVAGALEKQVVLRSFLGNVARRIVREAPCSVMLFTKPAVEPKPCRRIAFITDRSQHAARALLRTLRFAEAEACETLYVVRIFTTFDEARARATAAAAGTDAPPDAFEAEQRALEEWVLAAGDTTVPVEARCVRGNTGFLASDFVQTIEADLLVVPAATEPDPNTTLPGHIGWVTDVIPCNLWVIR